MRAFGFLSFGHYSPAPGSRTRTAGEMLRQTVEIAEGADEIGVNGAYVRVHHFARQAASPIPVLTAMAAWTKRIEVGTGVIDMRYENPLYLAEEAAALDLLSDGRVALGVSRGVARDRAARIRGVRLHRILGPPRRGHRAGPLRAVLGGDQRREGRRRRPADGASRQALDRAEVGDAAGAHLVGERLPRLRRLGRPDGAEHDDLDAAYFGNGRGGQDQIGIIDDMRSTFGKTYADTPDRLVEQLLADDAVMSADTLMLTIPNQLGPEYNLHVLESFATHVAPGLGWLPNTEGPVHGEL